MTDTTDEAGIPITVPRRSAASDEDSFGYDGEVIHHPDYSVVVPVVSDIFDSGTGVNARRFLQTAIALADDNDGRVVLLGVAVVADETALEHVREHASAADDGDGAERSLPEAVTERQSQLAQVVDVAAEIDQDLPVRAVVRVVTDTTRGILDALDGGSETAALLLRGAGFEAGWLLGNDTVDTVVDEAECDVFVENVGERDGSHAPYVPDVEGHTVAPLAESDEETVDSILLPVGTGPHSALAAEAARAVARTFDASVTVLHVVGPDASRKEHGDATDLLLFAEHILGPDVQSQTELREAADPTAVIIEEAQKHDFTAIGSPERKFRLRDLVFEPVQETLVGEGDVTVLMGRDADRRTRSLYYRYTRAMGDVDADEDSG